MGCSGRYSYGRFELDDVDDYGDAASSSDHGISENGWPADKNPSKIGIITLSLALKNGTKRVQVAQKAANALGAMIKWWDATIEPISTLGGYNYRDIRGSDTTLSNHSSGTAVDIDADKHPLAAEGTVTAQQAAMISAKAAELGLRWGGNYRHRKDEMHVELAPNAAVALASAIAGRVQDSVTGAGKSTGGRVLLLIAAAGAAWWLYNKRRARAA